MTSLSLMGNFPKPSRQAWLELAEQTLRGKPFEQVLTSTTLDGITLQPLYEVSAGDFDGGTGLGLEESERLGRREGAGAPWEIRAFCAAGAGSAEILAQVEGGADCVLLDLSGDVGAGSGDDSSGDSSNDSPLTAATFWQLLADVDLAQVRLALETGANWFQAAQALQQAGEQLLPPGASFQGSLRADPIASLARTGTLGEGRLAAWVADKPKVFSEMRTVGVAANVFADSGASEAQELGLSLAAGLWYLRELTDHGVAIDDACAELEFSYVASADIFATIAKLRAARLCWGRVAEVAGASPDARGQYQHVISSKSMFTRHDPTVNVLRTTAAAFAAAAAGADAICVLPYDLVVAARSGVGQPAAGQPHKPATHESDRLARNISHILLGEAQLDHVADPAGGSGYVQELTQALAHKAWDLFQQIEAEGGIVAVLESGQVAEWLDGTWQKRLQDIRHRRQAVCGVSEFPDLSELTQGGGAEPAGDGQAVAEPPTAKTAAAELPTARTAATEPPTAKTALAESPTAKPPDLLPLRRFSEPFESLRDRADSLAAKSQQRPTVFLGVLGSQAVASARVLFAENLLAAGGIVSATNSGESSPNGNAWQDELQAEFKASAAPVAVLCSPDEVYEDQAADAVDLLVEAGCQAIYLAGRIRGDALTKLPLDGSLYAGCDAVAFLDEVLSRFEQLAEGRRET